MSVPSDEPVTELPASVRLALWVTSAWRSGRPLAGALARSFPDVDHVAGDLARLDVWRDLGESALFVALPRPGDISRMPLGSVAGSAHAAESGECVFVAGIGGLLVPTLSEYGPVGDVGTRIDWTAYEADPLARHRMEMLELRDVERELLESLRLHSEQFEAVGGVPWGHGARASAAVSLDARIWGLPDHVPAKALRLISLAANVGLLAERAGSLSALGSGGVDVSTAHRREGLLRSLAADADAALADTTNVAVMTLAGWRPP